MYIKNHLKYCISQKRLDKKTKSISYRSETVYGANSHPKYYENHFFRIRKIRIHFQKPMILPKTVPLHTVESFLSTIYKQYRTACTVYQKRNALRDIVVAELLFATGMRISELYTLKTNDINLYDGTILIYGKGDKNTVSRLKMRQLLLF